MVSGCNNLNHIYGLSRRLIMYMYIEEVRIQSQLMNNFCVETICMWRINYLHKTSRLQVQSHILPCTYCYPLVYKAYRAVAKRQFRSYSPQVVEQPWFTPHTTSVRFLLILFCFTSTRSKHVWIEVMMFHKAYTDRCSYYLGQMSITEDRKLCQRWWLCPS